MPIIVDDVNVVTISFGPEVVKNNLFISEMLIMEYGFAVLLSSTT